MSRKKKILYLSQVYPYPADGGGKIKTLNTLKALATTYDVRAVFISEYQPSTTEKKYLENLGIKITVFFNPAILASVKDDLWGLTRNFLTGRPHYVFQYTHQPAFEFIHKTINTFQPDIIHIDHINIAQYLPAKKNVPWILEHHNVEAYLLWTRFLSSAKLTRKIYLGIEMVLTYLFEKRTLPKFDHIFAISEPEAQRVKKIYRVNQVTAQPLAFPLERVNRKAQTKKPSILFIGGLGWPPNEDAVVWFCQTMLPHIYRHVPTVEFHVVGKVHANVTTQLKKLKLKKQVVLHDYQKSLQPFLSQATVFVLPFRMGGGVRLKAFTALAAGLPVVSTSMGVEGLSVKPSVDCLVEDEPQAFAEAVVSVFTQPKLQAALSSSARAYIKDNHSATQNVKFLKEYRKVTP